MDTPDTPNYSLEELAADAARHQAEADKHLAHVELAKERIRELIGHKVGKHEAGKFQVAIQSNNRMDAAKFALEYPPETFPFLYKQVPDMDAIAPSTKKRFYLPGKPKVVIK